MLEELSLEALEGRYNSAWLQKHEDECRQILKIKTTVRSNARLLRALIAEIKKQ